MKYALCLLSIFIGIALHAADSSTLETDLLIVGGNESACAAAVQAAAGAGVTVAYLPGPEEGGEAMVGDEDEDGEEAPRAAPGRPAGGPDYSMAALMALSDVGSKR